MVTQKKVGFMGGGNMAEAVIKGLLAGGVPSTAITVAEPVEARRDYMRGNYGVKVHDDNREVAAASDVVILAVKPQVSGEVLKGIAAENLGGKLFISIMAGVKTETIENALGGSARVVRVMPNTPALVLESAAAISPGALATADDLLLAEDDGYHCDDRHEEG